MLHYADIDYRDRLLQLNVLPLTCLTMRCKYEEIVFFGSVYMAMLSPAPTYQPVGRYREILLWSQNATWHVCY